MGEKILIVEDEFIIASDLQAILENAGYLVTGIAPSVDAALRSIEQKKPELVLLDIQLLGNLTGIDLARQLKALDIAFVYLSANSNQQTLEEAKITEPYGFLLKPFRAKDVLVTLEIARYRHTHSNESRQAKEKTLLKALRAIEEQPMTWAAKIEQLAKAVQSSVSFDFITASMSTIEDGPVSWCGFFRTGFDQYQSIGLPELSNITGLKAEELHTQISKAGHPNVAAFYVAEHFQQYLKPDLFNERIAKKFNLASCLVLPLAQSGKNPMILSFFSRKAEIYGAGHLDLLERLQESLSAFAKMEPVQADTQPLQCTETNPVFKDIIGNSQQLLQVLDLVTQVAPHDTSVLVLGESGTGKERISTYIHELSPRKTKPLVKVNCAALPANLIESELFGHEKGAFTGATERRTGKFELADGGTIFLDEIGEMPLDLQAKLLRVLQEKEIERIGGKAPVKVNVRIVAATNRNLEKEVAEGRFRLDLYYRLNVFPIFFPPLRERKEDIELLTRHFAMQCCARTQKHFSGISPQMITALEHYHWPGNIRELENIVEQSVILNDGKSELILRRPLESTLFAPSFVAPDIETKVTVRTLEDVKQRQQQTERDYIIAVLKKAKGRIRGAGGAAELMQLKPTTLESRMVKLGVKKEDLF